MLFLVLLFFMGSISISIVGFSLYTGISPMPSSSKVKKEILNYLPNEPKKIYELGSGWGTLAFPIAEKKHHVKAFEISPIPYFYSKIVQRFRKKDCLCIHRKNFYDIDFSDADVVICYLFPGAMKKLRKKFEEELKPGAVVISNSFAVPGWKTDRVIVLNDCWKSQLLIYTQHK